MKNLGWSSSVWGKVLPIVLGIVTLGTLGVLGYVIATPKAGEGFTEFYILNLNNEAKDYPKESIVGEEESVIVGIVNREGETVIYRVEIKIDGVKDSEVGPISLVDEQIWKMVTSFTPTTAGDNQKIEFLLYKNEEVTPHLEPLYLRINAVE